MIIHSPPSFFHKVESNDQREEITNGPPCIIMATSGMLVGGPSVEYFKSLAPNEKYNYICIISRKGNLGRKIAEGAKEVQMKDQTQKTIGLEINLDIHQISGFTGHSDRKEPIEYAKRVKPRPKQFLVCSW